MEKFGYIYLTTNLITGQKYIGKHSGKYIKKYQSIDPSYYGSGTLLLEALKEYGKENFTIEILEWCYSEQELSDREVYWITKYDAMQSDNYYNRSYGKEFTSDGGCIFNKFPEEQYKATCKKISDTWRAFWNSEEGKLKKQELHEKFLALDPKTQEEWRQRGRDNSRRGWANMDTEKRNKFKEDCKKRSSGSRNPAARTVQCIETGDIFYTIKDAIAAGYTGDIGWACRRNALGEDAQVGGYHWKFIDNKYDETCGILFVKEKKKYNIKVHNKGHYVAYNIDTDEYIEFSDLALQANIEQSTIYTKIRNHEEILGTKNWKLKMKK